MQVDDSNLNNGVSTVQKYMSVRMVPPGDRKYFFTIAGKHYCAEDQQKILLEREP